MYRLLCTCTIFNDTTILIKIEILIKNFRTENIIIKLLLSFYYNYLLSSIQILDAS